MSDTRKLYRVEIQATFYAYAENENEAESYAQDALNDGGIEAYATEIKDPKNHKPQGGWERDCLIYHDGLGDVVLGDVLDGKVP